MKLLSACGVLLIALPCSSFLLPPQPRVSEVPSRATVAPTITDEECSSTAQSVLESIQRTVQEGRQWSSDMDLDEAEGGIYALFKAIREVNPVGLRGKPFVLRAAELESIGIKFGGYFDYTDLEKATEEDFLDAGRGSTDNRRGWKMTTVSTPRGNSFEDARMNFDQVESALEKGTVIFNSAGAHIPKLAGATLAAVDATSLPNALNMYVTKAGKRTSAPPHTDKQDVAVVQTSGRKHWRVYSPCDPSVEPDADMFARGKGDDNLDIFTFEKTFGSQLLLETTLEEGDVLFVPAAFPHTTGTAEEGSDDVSIHLTIGLDTHIWFLDYLQLRRLAYKRADAVDSKLGKMALDDNPYTGSVNELPSDQVSDLMEMLPMGFCEEGGADEGMIQQVSSELERIAQLVDPGSSSDIDPQVWRGTTERIQQHGKEMLDIHRDMYISAVEEGRLREAEAAMTSHMNQRKALTPEQMQRLSVFRVPKHFERINESNKSLMDWCSAGAAATTAAQGGGGGGAALPANWAFELPVAVGDQVEADLGGAFFEATVTRASGGTFDVQFFDGDKETGLSRDMIKLLTPPAQEEQMDAETAGMTPKELKRWKKKQEKKNKKRKK